MSQCVCYGRELRNCTNMLVGKVEQNDIVRDRNNMTIGKFESDGVVRDRHDMTLGKIERDGTIRDRHFYNVHPMVFVTYNTGRPASANVYADSPGPNGKYRPYRL